MTHTSHNLPLETRLASYLSHPRYEAQDASAIARGMGVFAKERPALRAILKEWEQDGKIIRIKQAKYILAPPKSTTLTGRVRHSRNGKLFFIPDAAATTQLQALFSLQDQAITELPIAPQRSCGAMHGDKVRVSIKLPPKHYQRQHKTAYTPSVPPEARVEEILERKRTEWVGIYRSGGKFGYVTGDGITAPKHIKITQKPPSNIKIGMAVCLDATRYPIGNMEAEGHISAILGYPGDAEADTLISLHRHGIRTEFPAEALEEAAQLPTLIPESEYAKRDDWRHATVFTIDPESAKDFDDAICVQEQENGWQLAVHIADVSHYVAPGGPLDREACLRGNSTYLPGRVIPMLPPRLSDDLCSLREGEDRLTKLCLMHINKQGKIYRAEFRNAVICSCARLRYEQVLAVIENKATTGKAAVDQAILSAHQLAQLLRRNRIKNGSLELESAELTLITDETGRVTDVATEHSDAAHQLIEELMLAANECVAKALTDTLTPTIYRIHEEPDAQKLQDFSLLARSYGIAAGALNSRAELVRVVEQIHLHEDKELLMAQLLRSMMRAKYAVQCSGHFGLAKTQYCHFTSPIRRYADLIVHRGFARLMFGKNATAPLPPVASLHTIAEHISETERNSAAAEQDATQAKVLQFLMDEAESDSPRPWKATIKDAYLQSLSVEIPLLRISGFIGAEHLETLGNGGWFFEPHTRRWCSPDGRYLLPGHSLNVVPTYVDAAARFVDFRPVSPL